MSDFANSKELNDVTSLQEMILLLTQAIISEREDRENSKVALSGELAILLDEIRGFDERSKFLRGRLTAVAGEKSVMQERKTQLLELDTRKQEMENQIRRLIAIKEDCENRLNKQIEFLSKVH